MKKWLFLLRAFFPSWKFFDDVGPELELQIRSGQTEESMSAWTNCLPPISRSFHNLLFNPAGNHLHACHNLLSHLKMDILECDVKNPESLAHKATYKMTKNLARFYLESRQKRMPPYLYQFRVIARFPVGSNRSDDIPLLSPVYAA